MLMIIPLKAFAQLELKEAFPNLTFTNPLDFEYADDGSGRVFVVEQAGIIKVFQNDSSATTSKIFLDISARVISGGELGLLGLAFHPDYRHNGYFYINYTYTFSAPGIITRISRFKVSSTNPDSADINSEQVLIEQVQPFNNHKGGRTTFGPDGYLYIGLGDGGSEGDPDNNGQNKATLLGKILRINVDSTEGNLNYSIPSTNPFKGNTLGWSEEIYAYGLRNPWRFSFDSVTGWLWCGDVGQDTWEEIDIVQNGRNYGWRCYEGFHPYNLTGCNDSNYVNPIWNYDHTGGNCAIMGGFVYRGKSMPQLYGKYIYADYCSNNIWSIQYDSTASPVNNLLLTFTGGNVTAFGVDQNQELYVCSFDGKIYKFSSTTNGINTSGIKLNDYYLTQNYPNPFNPSTIISYNIPEESRVKIEIIGVPGNIIKELVNELKPKGTNNIIWNGTGLASGVYYVRMTAFSISSGRTFEKIIKSVYLK